MTAAGPARDRWPALAMALALALAGGAADAQGLNFGCGQSY